MKRLLRSIALGACFAILCALLYWVGWLANSALVQGLWLELAAVVAAVALALGVAARSVERKLRLPVIGLPALVFAGSALRSFL